MGSGTVLRILLLATLAASVAACGRAGAPEAPKPAVAAGAPAPAQKQVEDRKFILDPLI